MRSGERQPNLLITFDNPKHLIVRFDKLANPSLNLAVHWVSDLTHYRPVMPFGNRKMYLRGSLVQYCHCHDFKNNSSGNMKFNKFGIFHSLKFNI